MQDSENPLEGEGVRSLMGNLGNIRVFIPAFLPFRHDLCWLRQSEGKKSCSLLEMAQNPGASPRIRHIWWGIVALPWSDSGKYSTSRSFSVVICNMGKQYLSPKTVVGSDE